METLKRRALLTYVVVINCAFWTVLVGAVHLSTY